MFNFVMARPSSFVDFPHSEPNRAARDLGLTSEAIVPQVGTTSAALLYLWLAFQLINQTLMPILVITFWASKYVKRHPTVVNACITWIFSGIISSLLLYTGKETGPEPPKLLCLAQAALLDGVPPMTSVATLSLAFQMYLSIRWPDKKENRPRTFALVVVPYAIFFCFSIAAAFSAYQTPAKVSRSRRFFYCSIDNAMSIIFAIFTAIILLAVMIYAVIISLYIHKNWIKIRTAGTYDLQLLSRVGLFGIYVFLAFLLSILSIFNPRNPFPDLFAASVGTCFAVILSSQPDVYRTWLGRSRSVPTFVKAPDRVECDMEKQEDTQVFSFTPVQPMQDTTRRDGDDGGMEGGSRGYVMDIRRNS
ncbi:hypothetical protein BU17DRAFT_101715 [Hysterangium stoloniferum]|nr:hypothetical protein BU17DRAFT_101715 [Hysterangium stoloniferum]